MSRKAGQPSRRTPRRPPPADELTTRRRAARIVRECRELGLLIAQEQGLSKKELSPLDRLVLQIPMKSDEAMAERSQPDDSARLVEEIAGQILEAAKGQTAFRLGRVYCFQCDSPDCQHTLPADRRDTFVGYHPTGKPSWKSFTNLCLERREPRIDLLYGEPPEVVSLILWANELSQGLLPAFSRRNLVYNLLGQVVAGLLPETLRFSRQPEERLALTLQILETESGGKGRRLRLNLIGVTPDEIAMAAQGQSPRDPPERLRRLVAETRRRLDAIGYQAALSRKRGEAVEVIGLVEPILLKLRTELERIFRPPPYRTQHAQQRHRTGGRPTSSALTDASQASDEKILKDAQKDTVIVLGPKSRVHVFTNEGKHVTSMQLQPGELDRKSGRKRWQPMTKEELSGFRDALALSRNRRESE